MPGRNPTKVRTHRYPNIQLKSIFSPSLGGTVRTHVTTGVLEEIDRVGGLDNYIFQAKPEHLGVWGLRIKYEMIQVRGFVRGVPLIGQAQLRRLTGGSQARPSDSSKRRSSLDPPPAPLLDGAPSPRLESEIVRAAVEGVELDPSDQSSRVESRVAA